MDNLMASPTLIEKKFNRFTLKGDRYFEQFGGIDIIKLSLKPRLQRLKKKILNIKSTY